jgi:hypothetical protein
VPPHDFARAVDERLQFLGSLPVAPQSSAQAIDERALLVLGIGDLAAARAEHARGVDQVPSARSRGQISGERLLMPVLQLGVEAERAP